MNAARRNVSMMLAAMACLPLCADDGAVIVRDGRVNCVVVAVRPTADETAGLDPVYVRTQAKASVEYAALAIGELSNHLVRVAAGEMKVVETDAAGASRAADEAARGGRTVIVLGGPLVAERDAPALVAPEAFSLRVAGGRVVIGSHTPKGVLNGVYELLEQLGFRWYLPGETGLVVPRGQTQTLAAQQTLQAPSFVHRLAVSYFPEWSLRMRLGGAGRRPGGHGIPLAGGRTLFKTHPEYFSLVRGERRASQLCLSHPDVLKLAVQAARERLRANPGTKVLSLGPNDGSNFCQCPGCTALDPKLQIPFTHPQTSMTDRYVWFFNQMLDALADEFPHVKIGFYAYAGTMMPPVKSAGADRMAVSLAPIHLCRIHGPNNPACPESDFNTKLYEAWRPFASERWDRGYWYNLACPGFPFSMVHRLREEIPIGHRLGVVGWGGDASIAWASHNPSMYIAAKLMWNHVADMEALLADFYAGYYGPAAAPMAAYHTLMDATIRDADCHSGGAWDMPFIYPEPLRQEARRLVEQAAQLAGPPAGTRGANDWNATAERVAITRQSLDFLDTYCRLRQHRDRCAFVDEMQELTQIDAIRDALLKNYEFPMLNPRHSVSYVDRFIRPVTVAGHARVTGTNTFVVAFTPEWRFLQDPDNWGQHMELFRPERTGGNWRTIRSDRTWSAQGLRAYFGQTWYRQSVNIPAAAGRKLMLWFSGVDNTADVWVNGQLVGSNHSGAVFDLDAFGSAFRPFAFDVTAAVRCGGENVVVVRHVRSRCNELGTGGIVGPVMIYAAGGGQ